MRLDLCLQVFLVILGSCSARSQLGKGLISNVVSCDNEGQEVSVTLVGNNPCLRCMCKDKHIQCSKQECASLKNCYLLLDEDRNKCCNVCKGCFFNGTYIPNDYEWTDPDSPCTRLTCKSGIITISNSTCITACKSPILPYPGQCCPSCPGCLLDGVELPEGKEVVDPKDPCVVCSCRNGSLSCVRKTCPVLACRMKMERRKPGECCASCLGTKKIPEVPHLCVIGNRNVSSGTAFKVDDCTKCTCVGTTSVCTRANCRKEILFKDDILYNDRPQEQFAHRNIQCVADGKTYENGTSWVPDGCSTCQCIDGDILCAMKKCEVTKCPLGYRLDFRDDPCCPVCVDDQSTCSVFGAGYIKSFDGHVSQFKSGPCKYVLAGECDASGKVNKTQFSVYIAFRGKQSKRPIFSIQLQDTTISLGRYHQIRVNGESVPLPHVQLGLFSLVRESFGMMLRTNLGLRVFWDGVSVLNVTVASSVYKSGCGLCGNMNGVASDDTRLPSGQQATTAKEWVAAWRVRSLAACKEPLVKVITQQPKASKAAAFKEKKLLRRLQRDLTLKDASEEVDSEESLQNLTMGSSNEEVLNFTSLRFYSARLNGTIINTAGVDWSRPKRNSKVMRRKSSVIVEGDLSADLAKFSKKSSLSKGVQKPSVTRNVVAFDEEQGIQAQLKPRFPDCRSWSMYFNVVSKCNEIGSHMYSQCHKKLKPSSYQKSCVRSACSCSAQNCEGTSSCDSVRSYSSECKKLALTKNTVKLFCQSD